MKNGKEEEQHRGAVLKGEESGFNLSRVTDIIKTTKSVTIHPFQTIHIQGVSKVRGHEKRANVMTDALPKSYSSAVPTVPRYSYLYQHSSRVGIRLHNLTSRQVTIKTPVAQITAANFIPP